MFAIGDEIIFEKDTYLISKFLGRGGMGHVFLIENKENGEKLALKTLDHFLRGDPNHQSIINGWNLAQAIKHENVINYRGFDEGLSGQQLPYLIMEFANSGSLAGFLKARDDLLDEAVCLSIFNQIIDGMEAVNETLVHRDIKPENIFIYDEIFKIADFGLSKIATDKTRSNTFKGWGSAPYTAPEAYRLEANTIQMDMYSIGHVFYKIAALQHAFGSPDNWEYAHLNAIPKALSSINASISPKVSAVINKLMNKRPKERYETWDAVRQDLKCATQNTGEYKSLVDNLLQKELSRNIILEREKTEAQQKEKEIDRKLNILKSLFIREFVTPIKDFIGAFNHASNGHSNINIIDKSQKNISSYQIVFGGKFIKIWFKYLDESDVRTTYYEDIWGNRQSIEIKPTFKERDILAWGALESDDEQGLNIIGLASSEDEYCDLYILRNKTATWNNDIWKPDPFAFSHDELFEEIYKVDITHRYETKVIPFNVNDILKFIEAHL